MKAALSVTVNVEASPVVGIETMVVRVPCPGVPSRHVLTPILAAAMDWVEEYPDIRSMRVEIGDAVEGKGE